MRYIGRIIANTKIEDVSEFIEVTDDSSSIIDNGAKIPTLIIGYKNAVRLCGEVRITEKKIGKNLYWTFSKRERRSDYIADLDAFQEEVFRFAKSCCEYEYLDPITWTDDTRLMFANLIIDRYKKFVYQTSTMYYIYYPHKGKTYGMSKDIMRYLGFPEDYFRKLSEKSSNNIMMIDEWNNTGDDNFVIPLLYYIKTF